MVLPNVFGPPGTLLALLDFKDLALRCIVGCKVFYNCSRECQEEHWKKTQRQHCKKLAQPRPILSNPTSLQKFQTQLMRELELLSTPGNPSHLEKLITLVHGMIIQWNHKSSIQDLEKIAVDLFFTRVKKLHLNSTVEAF